MSPELSPIEQAAVLHSTRLDGAQALADEIRSFLGKRGVRAKVGPADDEAFVGTIRADRCDLLIALGGDGTMLKAGTIAGARGTPILGINLGRVGFLIEVQRSHWQRALERVLGGDFWIEKRMRVQVRLSRGDEQVGAWEALNECAADRGRSSRPVRLRAEINGRHLTTYVADGLICATATGSTAYALAAGGPILPPETRNLLLVPVAPHLSMDRAIVLPEDSQVTITIEEPVDAHMHVDGQLSRPLKSGDRLELSACESDVHFVRLQDRGYFFRNLTAHLNSGDRRMDG